MTATQLLLTIAGPAVLAGLVLAVRAVRRKRAADKRNAASKTQSTDGGGGPIEP